MSSHALPTGLCERWNAVRERIAAAAARAGRPVPRLVAVTKSVGPGLAADLAGLGQIDLAENRVAALETKAAFLRERGFEPRWHLVGHLQRNKARRAVLLSHSIHSVDSAELGASLSRLALEQQRMPEVYVEVDYAQSGTRTGLREDDVPGVVAAVSALPALRLAGLMTIAPLPDFDGDTARARTTFARLRRLAERLAPDAFATGRPLLSMGMSSDFEVAIEEGSDLVRVGSALFEGTGGAA